MNCQEYSFTVDILSIYVVRRILNDLRLQQPSLGWLEHRVSFTVREFAVYGDSEAVQSAEKQIGAFLMRRDISGA